MNGVLLKAEAPKSIALIEASNLVDLWRTPDVVRRFYHTPTSSKPPETPVTGYGRLTAAYLMLSRYCGKVHQRHDKANQGMSAQIALNPAGSVTARVARFSILLGSLAATRTSPPSKLKEVT